MIMKKYVTFLIEACLFCKDGFKIRMPGAGWRSQGVEG